MEKMYSKPIPQSLFSFHIIVYLKSRVPQRNFALLLNQLKQLLFDASVKCSNNFSLNDILLNEPVVLDDLLVFLARIRFPTYAFSIYLKNIDKFLFQNLIRIYLY